MNDILKDVLIIGANVVLSLYVPFEVGRMIVRAVKNAESRRRIGVGPSDSVVALAGSMWLVRGGRIIAYVRKSLAGLMMASFVLGLFAGFVMGYGWAMVVWLVELFVLALLVDGLRVKGYGRNGVIAGHSSIRR